MSLTLEVAQSARKQLKRMPAKDRQRILKALQEMTDNPFAGDIETLKSQPTAFRRRVGDWRIFFDFHPDKKLIVVPLIKRRTSTTY